MKPLMDGDLLCYEVGFAAETGWKHLVPDSDSPPSWDYVERILNERISYICEQVNASCPPVFYFTGNTNFRIDIATLAKYKGNRDALKKPFHHKNIKAYLQGMYEWKLQEGLEADDLMAIDALKDKDAIICTRDKDLRQVVGAWFYSWELGNQPSFGPVLIEDPGTLSLSEDKKKLSGTGTIWFYAQCLIGDKVDNILGVPGIGPKKAYELLSDENGIITLDRAHKAVTEAYRGFYGDKGDEAFAENAKLLWMIRGLDDNNQPIMWRSEYE